MIIRAIIAILLTYWIGTAVASAQNINGWWGLNPDGCFDDEDNQYRVALGRFQKTPTGIVFGSGKIGIGMYDRGCDLENPMASRNELVFRAICRGEGAVTSGQVRIVMENEFTIRIFFPNEKKGWLLVRCGTLTRKDLIEGKGR